MVVTIKEDMEWLSQKYQVEYYRIYTLMEIIEKELKIRRREEFQSNKDLFYKKAYAIANHKLYTYKKFNSERSLNENYMK